MQHSVDRPEADRYVVVAGHVLFAVLLGIGTARAALTMPSEWIPIIGAVVAAVWYGVGAFRESKELIQQLWLLGLITIWFGLITVSAEFIWLAFLLAMLIWHLFLPRFAVPLAVALAVAAVVAFGIHHRQWTIGAILGPTVGVACAAVISAVYHRQRVQSEEHKRLLHELILTQQALATREREAGKLTERERLAREIHDTVGQSLSSVALLLRAAGAATGSVKPDIRRENQLRIALETTMVALAETRRFVRGLDPAAIDRDGLSQALAGLAQDDSQLGPPITFRIDGTVRAVDTPGQVALLRVAQEAISNARRHARAEHAAITLTFQRDEVSVDVVDDGVGFDPATINGIRHDGSGYGLTSMRARIAERGGELTIESEPGHGTALRATVPLLPSPDTEND